jgi:hypothetical protein
MRCPQCRHENPGDAKFCLECGRRLALMCTSCATELPADAKFCRECGAPVGTIIPAPSRTSAADSYTPKHLAERIIKSKAALEGERKQVTVLFADLKGSMELLADRDPEEARKLLDPVIEHMMEAVHRYEGYFHIEGRDDTRTIREKVTGKVLSLDRALEPSLAALLSLPELKELG